MSIHVLPLLRAVARKCPPAAYLFITPLRVADRLNGGPLHREMEKNISNYHADERLDPGYMRRLRRDMWYSYICYNCFFDEYFLFGFSRLSHAARQEFIFDSETLSLSREVSTAASCAVFWNKWNTYQHFRDYYKRDVIKLDSSSDYDEFLAFVSKHPCFIIKPCESYCGNGVFLCDTRTDGRSLQQIFADCQGVDVILEELIVQSEAMARLHPASVNTIRYATFLDDSGVHTLFAFLRSGQGGSVVDNRAAGGYVAAVDMQTGIVATPAMSKASESVLVHPDSGTQIIGMKIPRWEEATALVSELAMVVPEQKYASWDLALTDDGWVMVEGNHAGSLNGPQFATQHGIRHQLAPYFDL